MAQATIRRNRITFQPGAVAAGTSIALPAGHTAARYAHAEIRRFDHGHVVGTVTTTAGSVAAPAVFTPGNGVAPTTAVSVGTAALPAADENISSSTATTIPALVAAVATYVSATELSLSVATEASDLLVVDIVPVGEQPAWQ